MLVLNWNNTDGILALKFSESSVAIIHILGQCNCCVLQSNSIVYHDHRMWHTTIVFSCRSSQIVEPLPQAAAGVLNALTYLSHWQTIKLLNRNKDSMIWHVQPSFHHMVYGQCVESLADRYTDMHLVDNARDSHLESQLLGKTLISGIKNNGRFIIIWSAFV